MEICGDGYVWFLGLVYEFKFLNWCFDFCFCFCVSCGWGCWINGFDFCEVGVLLEVLV